MLEYLGYLASVVVLVSLLMSSAKKLRWINLIGGIIFSVYGFLIGALPVGIMNACISVINIYYLYKMYHSKDYFKTLEIDQKSQYLKYFLKFYKDDITKFFPSTEIDFENADISFYILRNIVPAGIFVGNKLEDKILEVDFDYVVPTFRDFKMGEYIYKEKKGLFLDKGFESLVTFTNNEKHEKYLKRMGFYREDTLSKKNLICYKYDLK
ncbi:MAG: YgjV family protein [Tenericutes bacterium]|nr:YgjV family protein [Mycoplasmatota bacterium]